MGRKEVRDWCRAHKAAVESVDALRQELQELDIPDLLRLANLSGDRLERVRALLMAEIIHARGLLDQTKKG